MNVLRLIALLLMASSASAAESITEISFEIEQDVSDPVRLMPAVTMSGGPQNRSATVDAFWDGGKTWRARFRVPQSGDYRWNVTAQSTDSPLRDFVSLDLGGEVTVTAASPNNAIRVSSDKTHLETVAGEPFFWLADTAWNGVLKSTDQEWSRYLNVRKSQGFNVVQFVSTPWRGGRSTLAHPPFEFDGDRLVSADPVALGKMDAKIRQLIDHDIVASPIMLWALNPDDPGEALSEADAIVLARYLLARWGAYRVVWMLGGDGRYPDKARWNRIGSAVFTDAARDGFMPPLVTTHPSGLSWVGDDFADSEWYDFHGYQSGHGDGENDLSKHLAGPWTRFPFNGKPRPVINLEPNYESHPAYRSGQPHSGGHVRRAAYWSVLLGPAAGVTYGHNAIWVWNHVGGEVAENHRFKVDAWSAGLETPGTASMTVMKNFFESGPWWELRHAPEVIHGPAAGNVDSAIVAASTPSKKWTVIYTPVQQGVHVSKDALEGEKKIEWIDPSTGDHHPAKSDTKVFAPPAGDHDWVLSIQAAED